MSTAHKETIRSLVPARMDRLPWTRFHWLIVVGLGVSWFLDGIEIQIVSSMGGPLQSSETLNLTSGQVGAAASWYLAGQVVGVLFFGRLTDRLGPKTVSHVVVTGYRWVARDCDRLWCMMFGRVGQVVE
ncbi:hypothetical protein PWJ90_38480, partial [Nocardia gipuzkoensis]|nr:hypothetical protein [Nocardia gipuzkoensis]